jgi:hypothetical protein
MYEKMDRKISGQLDKGDYGKYGRELSDGSISLISVELVNKDGESLDYVQMRAGATLIIRYLVNKPIQKPIFGVGIHTTDFIYLNTEQSYGSLEIDELCPGIHEISFQIKNMPLLPGVYSFRLGIASGESGGAAFYRDNALHFQVKADSVSRAWNASADEGFFALEAEWGIASEATDSGSSAT